MSRLLFPTPTDAASPDHPDLGELFPTFLPDPERYVYDHVLAATQAPLPERGPLLSFYADRTREQPAIPVVRGWPAYPGKVPAIGVAASNDTSDQQGESTAGGFAGRQIRYVDNDESKAPVGAADYYAEPLFSSVVVELIHENRDERDRLHNELRRVLFPLRRRLPARDELIKRVQVSGEKQELPLDEQPLVIYVSIFTVEVHYEMLEATNIVGADGFIEGIEITVTPEEYPS